MLTKSLDREKSRSSSVCRISREAPREEFEAMFAHRTYREVRKKYKAVGAFPEVFDKMHSLN